jgi:hypothetical protein
MKAIHLRGREVDFAQKVGLVAAIIAWAGIFPKWNSVEIATL